MWKGKDSDDIIDICNLYQENYVIYLCCSQSKEETALPESAKYTPLPDEPQEEDDMVHQGK